MSSTPKNRYKTDLLRQTHKFPLPKSSSFTSDETLIFFELVKHGKVTSLAQLFQGRSPDSLELLINERDELGRTALFYACYYDYKNIVLYLMIKGADPSIIDIHGCSIFHVLVNKGNIESLDMIINYFYFDLREFVDQELHDIKIECGLKKSDIRDGVLKSPDSHLKEVQENYMKLMSAVEELFIDYYQRVISFHNNILGEFKDHKNRTCLHYGSMGLHFHSAKCVENVMSVGKPKGYGNFEITFSELQNLEVDRKKRVDPRRTLSVMSSLKGFMFPKTRKVYFNKYKKNKNLMLKDSLNIQDKDGYTPLHISAFYGQYQLVILYLNNGSQTKIIDFVHKKEPIEYSKNKCIMKAIRDMNDSIIENDRVKFEFLLNSGFSIENPKSIRLSRPIQAALESKEGEMHESKEEREERFLSVILKCGADIDSTDSDGWTALHHASESGNIEHILILLKNFANIHIFSNKGLHAIHVAAMNNRYNVIQILVKNEADLNARDNEKRTPLHLAAKRGCKEAVRILLELGAKLYARDRRKWTALHYAAFYGQNPVVKLLCVYDDDKNKIRKMRNSQNKIAWDLSKTQKTKKYFRTLHQASREGKLDIVRKMIISGSDPNSTTRINQWTSLHLASMEGHLLVVRYLLENDADPEIIDHHGNKALDYAIAFNDPKVIGLIDAAMKKGKVKGTDLDEVKEETEESQGKKKNQDDQLKKAVKEAENVKMDEL